MVATHGGYPVAGHRSQLIMQRWEGSFIVLTLTAELQHQNLQLGLKLPAGHLLNPFRHPIMGGGLQRAT